MEINRAVNAIGDVMTVRRVYAEPYEKDGLTVITAASVAGGGGGGHGTDQRGQDGEGGGFAARARPVGAYVITNGEIRWRPIVDLNRIVTMVGLVAAAYILRRRRRRDP